MIINYRSYQSNSWSWICYKRDIISWNEKLVRPIGTLSSVQFSEFSCSFGPGEE